MGRQALLIGEVAVKSGLSRKALRLDEAAGIPAPPTRTPSGYRLYEADTLALLAFVTRARRLGLTLADIREVIAIRRVGRVPCPHVRTLIERKAMELTQTLRALRGLLASWRAQRDGETAVCPHIEAKGGEGPWKRFVSRSARRVCGACPEVVLEGDHVHIGEAGNRAVLSKEEWNVLVHLIRSGQLTDL